MSLTTELLIYGFVLPASLWLAVRAFRRHLRIAERLSGPYWVRHGALVWALGVWSGTTYAGVFQQHGADDTVAAFIRELLFRGIVTLPVCLWVGAVVFRVLGRGLGMDLDRAE